MDFSDVHIVFSAKHKKAKQITQDKSKHGVSLNELSTSESAGQFLKKKKKFPKNGPSFKNCTFSKAIFFQNAGHSRLSREDSHTTFFLPVQL